jgi:hypothetical protein
MLAASTFAGTSTASDHSSPAQTIGGLQDRLLERSEALPRIGLDADAGIRRRAERAGQHRIGEQCDVDAGAAPVLALKIERGRLEGADEFIEPAWIGALEVLDALLGVAERHQPALLAKACDHRPFDGVRVLELVDDDERIGRAIDTCKQGHGLE